MSVGEVSVGMHDAVMPEEFPVMEGDLSTPGHHQLEYLFERTGERSEKKCTYALPVFAFLGLTSLALKLAKKSSQGQAA